MKKTDGVRIALIGGTGEFGRLFAKMLRNEGHDVTITGRTKDKGIRISSQLGVRYTSDNIKAAQESDIVIITVPIGNTVPVIKEVAPHIGPGKLLMDLTSVKMEPMQAMMDTAPEDVEVVGAHPMFGPRVTSLEGQIVILTPGRGKKWLTFLKDLFQKLRARVYESTPAEHDQMMALVQGLTHFAYITTASTIRRLDMDIDDTRRFASPVYELMLDFIARIVGQNPHLYADIQLHNPYVKRVHEAFIECAEELREAVQNNDGASFMRIMTDSARIFKDVDASMGKSDKAISALTSELKALKGSLGHMVYLRHIYSGQVHFGKVTNLDSEKVSLEWLGKKTVLKISNIELLNDGEINEWKKSSLPTKCFDHSVIFPEDLDESILAKVLLNVSPDIASVEVKDVFRGSQIPSGHKSITLRIETFDPGSNEIVISYLKGLGGKIR